MKRRATVPARINIIGEHTDYGGGLALPFAIDQKLVLEVNFDSNEYLGNSTAIELWKAAGGPPALLNVQSNIPIGKGMSSSAALCVAISMCVTGQERTLATCLLAQKIEHEILGTKCGLLDQMAVVFAKKNHASLIDFGNNSIEHIKLVDSWKFKLVDSGVHRNLAETDYSLNIDKRSVHVIEESNRVLLARQASAMELGDLLNQSHESLRKLGVSLPIIDEAVKQLQETDGVHGARMMGGGFGGMILVLVDDAGVLPEIPIASSSSSAVLEEEF